MSTLFDKYRRKSTAAVKAKQSEYFVKANEILSMYRRFIEYEHSKPTADDLQCFFDLLQAGHTAFSICQKIEQYADRLQAVPPQKFCERFKKPNLR